MLNLPKGYLSYSAISMWQKNKDQYRARYYRDEQTYENEEMRFGKKIARLLETEDFSEYPTLAEVSRYASPEHSIIREIDGVPIKAFIDSFNPETNAFREYKTGHKNGKGNPPWNKVSVTKHNQLPFYSMLIEEEYGKVDPLCHLDWIETVFEKRSLEFEGHTLESGGGKLILTGSIFIFPRRIYKWERKRMKDMIRIAADEISKDYTSYLKTHG